MYADENINYCLDDGARLSGISGRIDSTVDSNDYNSTKILAANLAPPHEGD